MSFEIIAGLFCLLTGIVLMFWLNYKVHLKVSGLESDCRIIRSQIKLNSETVKYDLTLIINHISDLYNKLSKLEISNEAKIVSKEESSQKTLFDDLWKIEPPVKK